MAFMRISTVLLAASVTGVSCAWISLYVDNRHLHDQLDQLQASSSWVAPRANSSITAAIAGLEPTGIGTKALPADAATDAATDAAYQLQEDNLRQALEKKYALLFSTLRLSSQDQEKVRALLLQRERILSSPNASYLVTALEIKNNEDNQKRLVAEVDSRISAFLTSDDNRKYQLLKDSSYEQYQIESFYDGLTNKEGLTQEKKNILIMSKLEHKHAYANLLSASADEINDAHPAERAALAERFRDSLRTYDDAYFDVARQYLNAEQFAALRDSEQKQFDEVWQGVLNGWKGE